MTNWGFDVLQTIATLGPNLEFQLNLKSCRSCTCKLGHAVAWFLGWHPTRLAYKSLFPDFWCASQRVGRRQRWASEALSVTLRQKGGEIIWTQLSRHQRFLVDFAVLSTEESCLWMHLNARVGQKCRKKLVEKLVNINERQKHTPIHTNASQTNYTSFKENRRSQVGERTNMWRMCQEVIAKYTDMIDFFFYFLHIKNQRQTIHWWKKTEVCWSTRFFWCIAD